MLAEAGYNHYEISSYSKSGFECRHNLTYWKNDSFYGFGLGSASFTNGVRFSRPRSLKEYMGYVQNLEDGVVESCEDDRVNGNETAMDVVMLSLRTARGLDLKSFKKAFGGSLVFSLCKVFKPYVASGHVNFMDEHRRDITEDEFNSLLSDEQMVEEKLAFVRLSDPDGFLLSNELISLAFGAIAP